MRLRTVFAALALVSSVAPAQAEAPVRSVVLSPEVGADVISLLEAADLRVTTIVSASNTLEAAVAAARRVLGLQDGPSVLVARGWDGAVASEIGGEANVAALVFVAAQAPEIGEAFSALTERFPLKTEAAPLSGKTTAAAWRGRPVFYAVSEQDPVMSAELQRFYAARMNAKTIVLDDVALHPREIAGLILEAAGMKPAACGSEGDDGVAACAAKALPRSLMKGCKCERGSLEDLTSP